MHNYVVFGQALFFLEFLIVLLINLLIFFVIFIINNMSYSFKIQKTG